ncbi:small subunit ribosomal protein S1 [Lachnospiraceae bacterium PF1-21]|uniref:S1 RNA-binding domain-containing protein n=1 Tax=Ohessyouella blattaphilus TaxID=2949333 RepID=UPI003E214A02
MSDEIKNEELNEETTTMADLEDHFDDANPWNRLQKYMEDKTVLNIKVEGVVNGGVIAHVEGIRGFIPASKLSLSYVEDLETYLLKEMEVQVIDVNQAENRLVLSAVEILKKKKQQEQAKKLEDVKVGSVTTGTVDSLQTYGAFVVLENGLSGLVHVSQISRKRVKSPADVLKKGDKVDVKIIGIKDGKISLSMKALEPGGDDGYEREENFKVDIPKAEDISLNMGDLFKDIKLD